MCKNLNSEGISQHVTTEIPILYLPFFSIYLFTSQNNFFFQFWCLVGNKSVSNMWRSGRVATITTSIVPPRPLRRSCLTGPSRTFSEYKHCFDSCCSTTPADTDVVTLRTALPERFSSRQVTLLQMESKAETRRLLTLVCSSSKIGWNMPI